MKNYFILFFLLVYGFNVESHTIYLSLREVEKRYDDFKERFYGLNEDKLNDTTYNDFFEKFKEKALSQFRLSQNSNINHSQHLTHQDILESQLKRVAADYNIPEEEEEELLESLRQTIIERIKGDEYKISLMTDFINDHFTFLSVLGGIGFLSIVAYLYKKFVGVIVIYKNG